MELRRIRGWHKIDEKMYNVIRIDLNDSIFNDCVVEVPEANNAR